MLEMDSSQSTQLTKLVSDQSKISGSSSTKIKTISSGKQKSSHVKGKSLGKKDDKIKSFSTETTKMDKFQEVASIHQFPVEKQLSAAEQDYLQAKSYLMTASSLTNISVYDHLVELLRKLLSEKPINAVDALEDISENIKLRRLYSKGEYTELPTKILKVAQSYLQLLMEITIKDEAGEFPVQSKNLMKIIDDEKIINSFKPYLNFLQDCGIGLSQEEYYHIYFSLIFLAKTRPIENVRFWGKIYGMINDYIIVEATLKNNAELSDMEDLMFRMKEQEEFSNINYPDDYTGPRDQYENLVPVQSRLLEPEVESTKYVLPEDIGRGANKYIYFACNQIGGTWTLLPNVTSDQIFVAKIIKKAFTGVYDTPVLSYPPFPGKEINLLRAQITCISSSTLISPIGYYEIKEEEIGEKGVQYSLNKVENFQISVEALTNPDLSSWVHHSYHVLPQGHCMKTQKKFGNISKTDVIDEEKEEEILRDTSKEEKSMIFEALEQEKETNEIYVQEETSLVEFEEKEISEGPPLFSPVSNDNVINGVYPWTVMSSSNLMSQYAISIMKSNIWPGSYAICDGITLENVYIGTGVKHSGIPYSPQLPPFPKDQYSSQETVEHLDPSPDDDEEYQKVLETLKLREERRAQIKEERLLKIEEIKEKRKKQNDDVEHELEAEDSELLEEIDIQIEETVSIVKSDSKEDILSLKSKRISSVSKSSNKVLENGTKHESRKIAESQKQILKQVKSEKYNTEKHRKESKKTEAIPVLEKQRSFVISKSETSKPIEILEEESLKQEHSQSMLISNEETEAINFSNKRNLPSVISIPSEKNISGSDSKVETDKIIHLTLKDSSSSVPEKQMSKVEPVIEIQTLKSPSFPAHILDLKSQTLEKNIQPSYTETSESPKYAPELKESEKIIQSAHLETSESPKHILDSKKSEKRNSSNFIESIPSQKYLSEKEIPLSKVKANSLKLSSHKSLELPSDNESTLFIDKLSAENLNIPSEVKQLDLIQDYETTSEISVHPDSNLQVLKSVSGKQSFITEMEKEPNTFKSFSDSKEVSHLSSKDFKTITSETELNEDKIIAEVSHEKNTQILPEYTDFSKVSSSPKASKFFSFKSADTNFQKKSPSKISVDIKISKMVTEKSNKLAELLSDYEEPKEERQKNKRKKQEKK
ncbi:uncharacterized protein Rsph4a [Centruroides vittatus]|uniref:uncharacterized protein Rsph4a n=1 Tax=Centruroides vittatus TaxID=120091 RepID=UPI0035104A9B